MSLSTSRPASYQIHEQDVCEPIRSISEAVALSFPKAPICCSLCVGSSKKIANSLAYIMGKDKANTVVNPCQFATKHNIATKEFLSTTKKLEASLKSGEGAAARLAYLEAGRKFDCILAECQGTYIPELQECLD